MDQINAASAARRLGTTEWAVRKMISAGRLPNRARSGPALVASADVDRVMHERRAEALRRHPDATAFAREIRAQLWPGEAIRTVTTVDGRESVADMRAAAGTWGLAHGRAALRWLTPDAGAVFGRDTLEAAAAPASAFAGVCRTCYADTSARVHGGLRPTDAPAYRVLLGEPCAADRARWATEAEERRRAAARADSAERIRRAEAERAAARAEFSAAQEAASVAVSRARSAARALAAVDPAVARETAVRARGRAALAASADLSCGCTRNVYCGEHAAVFGTTDRRAARS